jgi:FkbM family methyltransferase
MENLSVLEKRTLEVCMETISRQKSPQFAYHLYFLALNGLGVLNFQNSSISGEKNLIDNVLPNLIHNDFPIFFDVGACHGHYALQLQERFSNAIIHCFEPHPKNFQILERIDSPNIVCHNIGLGEKTGFSTLFDRSDMDASSHASLYSKVIQEIHKQELISYEIEISTIDDIVEKKNISQIDFIKIDTEGHELSVLKGASKALASGIIRCIQFEFNEMNVISRTFFRDFKKVLRNFTFYRLLPNGLVHLGDKPVMTEVFAFQNIVAFPFYLREQICSLT